MRIIRMGLRIVTVTAFIGLGFAAYAGYNIRVTANNRIASIERMLALALSLCKNPVVRHAMTRASERDIVAHEHLRRLGWWYPFTIVAVSGAIQRAEIAREEALLQFERCLAHSQRQLHWRKPTREMEREVLPPSPVGPQ